MLDHKSMSHELKENIIEYLRDHINDFNYNVISEMTVLYATKMDKTYRDTFFKWIKDKLFRDLKYLDNDNFYKIIWSLVKSE